MGRAEVCQDHDRLRSGDLLFDDTGRGQVRVPASWKLFYRDDDAWKPVEIRGSYGVERDRFNRVVFMPIMTTALRIEVIAQSQWSIGIQEWRVKWLLFIVRVARWATQSALRKSPVPRGDSAAGPRQSHWSRPGAIRQTLLP